MTRGSL